jgi:hypothetical protein
MFAECRPFLCARTVSLANPVQILNDIVVPDAHHAIPTGAEVAVALPVVRAIRMLAAIEFYDQAPLATHEVDVVAVDGLLADEFEAAELPTAKACPQREFCGRAPRSDRARSARV